MDEPNKKWIDNTLNSMKGSKRAKPRPELLEELEERLFQTEAKLIPFAQLRAVAAAGILLLLANVWAIRNITTNASEIVVTEESEAETLLADYNFYEL